MTERAQTMARLTERLATQLKEAQVRFVCGWFGGAGRPHRAPPKLRCDAAACAQATAQARDAELVRLSMPKSGK
jgi:hypothetical protein